jgi:hypothetical protein
MGTGSLRAAHSLTFQTQAAWPASLERVDAYPSSIAFLIPLSQIRESNATENRDAMLGAPTGMSDTRPMKERWLLAAIASCALTACFPARMTEQPGFELEVRDRYTGSVLPGALVHFVKVRMDAQHPEIVMREFRTDITGVVRFERRTDWQFIVPLPEQNYTWEWYLCVDKEGYLPVANNVVEAEPPTRVLLELKKAKGVERCTWHSTQPYGFNLPGMTAFVRPAPR